MMERGTNVYVASPLSSEGCQKNVSEADFEDSVSKPFIILHIVLSPKETDTIDCRIPSTGQINLIV